MILLKCAMAGDTGIFTAFRQIYTFPMSDKVKSVSCLLNLFW